MDQVGGEPSVIPEFVQQYFVSRKVRCPLSGRQAKMEGGLAEGIEMRAFSHMPYGGNGEDEFFFGMGIHYPAKYGTDLPYRKHLVRKLSGRPFQAVGDHFSAGYEFPL